MLSGYAVQCRGSDGDAIRGGAARSVVGVAKPGAARIPCLSFGQHQDLVPILQVLIDGVTGAVRAMQTARSDFAWHR